MRRLLACVTILFATSSAGASDYGWTLVRSATKRIPEKALLALFERIEELRSD